MKPGYVDENILTLSHENLTVSIGGLYSQQPPNSVLGHIGDRNQRDEMGQIMKSILLTRSQKDIFF